MITCTLRYRIDPYKLDEFEAYARMWLPLVGRFGGIHHGYFLPHEGPNDIAYAMFSFESLAAYERYREAAAEDPDCAAAYAYATDTRCIVAYERSFTRPLLVADAAATLARTGTDADATAGEGGGAGDGRADVIDIDEGRHH